VSILLLGVVLIGFREWSERNEKRKFESAYYNEDFVPAASLAYEPSRNR
jgi:hypothetical protein